MLRLLRERTSEIAFFKVNDEVSETCTRSKNLSRIKPSLSTNLKTMAICSLFDSSRDSSTRIQNFSLPISSRMALRVFAAKICKISF
ncbi:hypothetical protein LguiA_025486 [Lonicera macranthoides]